MSVISYTVTTAYEGPTTMAGTLPAGRIVRFEAEMILPAAATREEVMEWVMYQLGWGSLAHGNPLSNHDIEVQGEPLLTDTGYTTDRLRVREEALK